MDDRYSETLALVRARFGTLNLRWILTGDSNALMLAPQTGPVHMAVPLGRRQAAEIRHLTAALSSLLLDTYLDGVLLNLHLIGRQVSSRQWEGTAAPNLYGAMGIPDFARGSSFAGMLLEELGSVVMLLDHHGTIQGCNQIAEEYAGCKEADVLGLEAGALFMSEQEAAASIQNIASFFSTGKAFQVERRIQTIKGPRLFKFRTRFVRSDIDPTQRLLVCAGTDVSDRDVSLILE